MECPQGSCYPYDSMKSQFVLKQSSDSVRDTTEQSHTTSLPPATIHHSFSPMSFFLMAASHVNICHVMSVSCCCCDMTAPLIPYWYRSVSVANTLPQGQHREMSRPGPYLCDVVHVYTSAQTVPHALTRTWGSIHHHWPSTYLIINICHTDWFPTCSSKSKLCTAISTQPPADVILSACGWLNIIMP